MDDTEQRQSSTSIGVASVADLRKAVWVCRVLAIFAAVLAGMHERDHNSLTALAFAALGFGIAMVLIIVHPGDREWVSSVVVGLVGLVMMKALFQIVGIGW